MKDNVKLNAKEMNIELVLVFICATGMICFSGVMTLKS